MAKSPRPMKTGQYYQFKLTFAGIKPPIWRRLLVPDHLTLLGLHEIIQFVGDWNDDHLHAFTIGDTDYGRPDPYGNLSFKNDARVKLNSLSLEKGTTFTYVYDFGDDWLIKIRLERILAGEEAPEHASCPAGARAFPPEDCGGVPGYLDLLDAFVDPEHPEHEDSLEWLGDEYDPEEFNIAGINLGLAKVR